MQRLRKKYFDTAPFDSNAPLVFTHMDLHLRIRNIIFGDDGQLWVIDWADADWYPSWFESASMSLFSLTAILVKVDIVHSRVMSAARAIAVYTGDIILP
jgi:hypothetical protein